MTIMDLPVLGQVDSDGPVPDLEGSQRMLIGYSVRNSAFNKSFFDKVLPFVARYASEAAIAIFDVPYAYNDAADDGRDHPTADEIERNSHIGDERASMVQRLVRQLDAQNIEILRWATLCDVPMVRSLREELAKAVASNPSLYNSLLSNAIEWLARFGRVHSQFFLNFQIQEIPVLTYLYYDAGYLIDIYPGRNFSIFKELECGLWKVELPLATETVRGQKLTFLNVGGGFL